MTLPRDRRSIDEFPEVPLSSHVESYLGFFIAANGELTPEYFTEVSHNQEELEQLRAAVESSAGFEVTEVDILLGLNNLTTMFK